MKDNIIYSILIILGLAFLTGVVCMVLSCQEKTYCGVIKYKVDATRYGKHTAYADPIFVVQFDGFTEEIHPTWDHYLSSKPADNVCYKLKDREKKGLDRIALTLTMGSLVLAFITCIFKLFSFSE